MVERPWSSSHLSCGACLLLRCDRYDRNFSRPIRERIPHLEPGGGIGAPLDVGGTLLIPMEWRRVLVEPLDLQLGCEGPFGSSRR